MTTHSDHAKSTTPKTMQVWVFVHLFTFQSCVVLSVDPSEKYNQVRYRKLTGRNKGKTYYATIPDFTRLYTYSH